MRIGAIILLCLFAANCGNPNTKADKYALGDANALLTGPATRFITERPRRIPGDGVLPTLCTEPSPDVAIAFSQSAAIAANISTPSGPSGSGTASYSSSEVATALSGRTAGVLALRDGLYAACQTYVNGIIGHDAYALILSQYGNLLVALAGTGTTNAATFTAKDAASTALLVSCLSAHDPTRLSAGVTNPLLNTTFCGRLMERIARGAPIASLAGGEKHASVQEESKSGSLGKAGTPPTGSK
ncbi:MULTISPECIES: hypothetical protein [unclassified Bradyrhizobium]|uniref:hypothetical protein n=1 Tax=unclassified Bradyrhizobium TaxID=2631580 RepID=UPI002305897C|nr:MULTISPECIES: hypothetical protein [unclassified Bradyrhizobium]MDA9451160.1 hypothetical protein [Bradyrhizobium sp. CCBAU 21360]MDA9457539.1 hypothetical protein [Bradyrhizobium sp. CCBAU 21359]